MFQRLFATSIVCLLLAGCGDANPRRAVSGTVTLDDAPLEQGSILFSPLASGPSAGGEIQQGRYELAGDRGPAPGSYRVEISSWRSTGRVVVNEATGATEENLVSAIPPRYNTRSELEVIVKEDGENTFDFPLESK